ncbi:MAG TPA: MFS transporter [Acidimicrobiales bacterium]|nr:MFS transporter [Acidimicrobiales bacterium]
MDSVDRDVRSSTATAPPGEPPGGAAAWRAWGLGVTTYLVAVFHRMSLGVGAIDAERRFHIGPSLLSVFVAVQLGLYAALQIPTGAAADRFGPRRMLTAALVLMAAGETLFALATSPALGIAGRALVGTGDALTFLSVLRLVQNWFPARRYGLLAALTGLVGGVGQLISTVPLRQSLSHLHWSATFLVTAVATGVFAVALATALRDRPPGAPVVHAAEPMHHAVRAVMRRSGTWQGMWVHFALTGPFVVFTALWGYPYLVRVQHDTAAGASVVLACVVVTTIVSAPVVGFLISHAPRSRPAIVLVSAGLLLAAWGLALLWGAGPVPPACIALLVLATGVAGPASIVGFDLAREANRADRGGAATGVVNIGGFTGAVVVDVAIGVILATFGHGAGNGSGFRLALATLPAMVALGLLLFVLTSARAARQLSAEPITPAAPAPVGVAPG